MYKYRELRGIYTPPSTFPCSMGRVEAVRDGNGVVTHVSKEVEEKEEAPGQQRRE
jgi:hypothetical protein